MKVLSNAIPYDGSVFFLPTPPFFFFVFLTKINASKESLLFLLVNFVFGRKYSVHTYKLLSPSILVSLQHPPATEAFLEGNEHRTPSTICFHDAQSFSESLNQLHSTSAHAICLMFTSLALLI